jgi:hypothetical protein
LLRTLGVVKLHAPTAWTTTRNSHLFLDGVRPGFLTEWLSSRHRVSEGLFLGLCLRPVHVLNPLGGALHRPLTEARGLTGATALKAGPAPILGSLDQTRTKRIPLDVTAYPKKVSIVADRNGLEPTLIDCSLSIEIAQRLPSPCMGGRQPMHESREGAV